MESDSVKRVIAVLEKNMLLKRELRWLRTMEPEEYKKLLAELKAAIDGNS